MRWCSLVLLLFLSAAASATDYFAAGSAGKGFSPAGSDGNSGLSAALPKSESWCLTNLSAGDSCTYASGNYTTFKLTIAVSGTAGNQILFDCEAKHTCSVGRITVNGQSYVEVRRFKGDTDFYDPTHNFNNPRVLINDADHIILTSLFIRGEPERCAPANVGPGCRDADPDRRYNDLVTIDSKSHHIELRSHDTFGEMRLLDGNHASIQLFDDGTGGADQCTADERYYWIHGTPDTPLIMSMRYHHGFSNKGVCDALVEHVEIQQQGNGRGDLQQPTNADDDVQAGGAFHGSDHRRYVVRFSTMALAGSGTSDDSNLAFLETGLFGGNIFVAEDVCFAHLSQYRAWGQAVIVGRLNTVTNVDDIAYLNIASDQIGYLDETEGSGVADDDATGFFIERTNASSAVTDIFLDGIVFNNVSSIGADQFLIDTVGTQTTHASTVCPTTIEGVECGSSITYDTGQLFTDPENSDWTINDASLTDNAVPIALTTDSGTGSTIAVTDARSHCFVDDMDGMRPSGDVLDINGDECTVTAVGSASITCNETITWASSEEIRYKLGGVIHNDIGAIISGADPGEPPLPGPGRTMKPHL